MKRIKKWVNIEVGKEYHIKHVRKGNFNLRVTAIPGEGFVRGEITKGEAKYLASDDAIVGETITVNTILAEVFELAKGEQA